MHNPTLTVNIWELKSKNKKLNYMWAGERLPATQIQEERKNKKKKSKVKSKKRSYKAHKNQWYLKIKKWERKRKWRRWRTEREIILFFIFSPLSSSCFSSIYSIYFHCFLLCCLPSPREKENYFFFLLWLPCGWGLPKPKILLSLPRNRPWI